MALVVRGLVEQRVRIMHGRRLCGSAFLEIFVVLQAATWLLNCHLVVLCHEGRNFGCGILFVARDLLSRSWIVGLRLVRLVQRFRLVAVSVRAIRSILWRQLGLSLLRSRCCQTSHVLGIL